MKRQITTALTCLMVFTGMVLSACGGGRAANGDSGEAKAAATLPPVFMPTTAFSGVYDGTLTDAGRAVTALMQDDGTYFMIYSDTRGMPAGAIVGKSAVAGGSLSSNGALDLSLVGSGTQSPVQATVSGTAVQGQSFSGTIAYAPPRTNTAFATKFNSSYTTLPPLSEIAGTYIGAVATASVKEDQIQLQVDSSGNISGKLSCGCEISATLSKGTAQNSYQIALRFVGGEHVLSNKSLAGNVYYDMTLKRIYIVGNVAGEEMGLFVGTKQ